MGTYAHRIYVQWGTDSAPASVFVLDAAGVKHTPTLTTPIAEVTAGTGNYFAVATYDHVWGAGRDFWRDAGGAEYPGDGPAPTDVVLVDGEPATPEVGAYASAEEVADALAARTPVYVNTKVAGGAIEIIRKDSYKSSEGTGRLLTFTKVATETYWPDTITTAHFYCKPTQETLDLYPSAVSLTDVSMTVVDGTGSDQQVTLELTSAQTGSLQAGLVNTAGYKFWIIANKDTEPAVLRNGTMTVRPDPTAT
jgi:hypothetical protein